jgi:hypothetical protein
MEYGQPQEIPLIDLDTSLLGDLARAGDISDFDGDPVTLENIEGIKSYFVDTLGEDGYVNGGIFVVVHENAGRAGVVSNGDPVWMDACNIDEALLVYDRGGE